MKRLLLWAFAWPIGLSVWAQTPTPLNVPGGAETVRPGTPPTAQQGNLPATAAALPTGDPIVSINGFRRFNDPLLNTLIEQGLQQSPNLKAALSRLEEARMRVGIAQSYLKPSVRSSALLTTQSLSEHRPLAIPSTTDRLPRFQLNTFQLLPLDASYELDLFKRIRNTVAVANLQTQIAIADIQAFRLALAADIARTYFLIRGNEAEQIVFRLNLLSRDSTLAILRERFRVGLINQIDVQRAETDYSGLQVMLKGLVRVRTELVNALAQLCAQDPATFTIPEGSLPTDLPAYPYLQLQAEQLQRRPDIMQALRQNQVTAAQIDVQATNARPRIMVVGTGGLLSGKLGAWFLPSSATYLVGLNASVPLYEGLRAKQNVALARQQLQTGQQQYEQALQVARRDVETALDNLNLLREQRALQQQTLSLAQRTLQYNRELYVRGLSTYLEVLDAQRTILTTEQQLVQLQSLEAQQVVALLRALGGDF